MMNGMKKIFLSLVLSFMLSGVCIAEQAESIKEAFENGTCKGTIGSYFESINSEANNSDTGWGTGYLTIKYETQEWNYIQMGTRVFAHNQFYSDRDNGATDPFDVDIESKYTVPELYLNYGFNDNSSMTIGRWAHAKISHIDDAQSEGAYLTVKNLSSWEIITGFMTRFAEIDYDDGEDFGRNNNTQDLSSSAVYGSDSGDYLIFIEGKNKPCDMLNLNPYVMYQEDYATVYGLDTKIEKETENKEITYGTQINYYHVAANISGSSDSDNFAVFPYIKKGNVEATVGYARFDDGNSLNKPAWLRDYFTVLDQQREYGRSGSDKYFAKVKLTLDKFWTHFAYGDNNYDFAANVGDESHEYDLQFGYKFTKNLDVNLRLFDVRYDNVNNKDYHKAEMCARFNF